MSSWQQPKYELAAEELPELPRHPVFKSSHNTAANAAPHLAAPHLVTPCPESYGGRPLSVALIGPNEERRATAVQLLGSKGGNGICEFSSYPPELSDVPRMLEEKYDVIIIELDSDPECALGLVESIGSSGVATVMVYSESADPELLVRCMRAGAREFLTVPFVPEEITEALTRAAARRPTRRADRQTASNMLAFMSAKGGAGATTLACNFAVALAQEFSDQKTLLIDLDLPLGDAALNMGIVAEFSAIDALQAAERLDAQFLAQLLVKHSSGLSVLAAPGRFVPFQSSDEAIDRLLKVAQEEFDNVVVDLGSRLDLMSTAAFKNATSVYLVTQASIPELRNSNRLITQFFSGVAPKLEVVINRFESRGLGVTEDQIAKALTKPAQWKIPNDYASVKKMQIDATPLVLADSPLAHEIRRMAKAALGQQEEEPKKKGFRLFR